MMADSGDYEHAYAEQANGAPVVWDSIPEHLQGGLDRYISHGIMPGHFLTAVLSNDLKGAMTRADDTSRAALYSIVLFLWNQCPQGCWGSLQRVEDWVRSGGLIGKPEGGDLE
jgi:hypothetical protein